MLRSGWLLGCVALLVVMTGVDRPQTPADPGEPGPYGVASVSVVVTNPNNGNSLDTDIYFPAKSGSFDPAGAPYPAVVFSRGYFFILSGTALYSGNATHLASWGYIVAMVDFPDEESEPRAEDVRYILTYLEAENARSGSTFYGRIDTSRLGLLGHSKGGLTTLMVAARDPRVRVAFALDPVNTTPDMGGPPWEYATEAPNITAPLGIFAAPPQSCNSDANYEDMYPAVGSDHKALWVMTSASHCDFLDSNNAQQRDLCYLFCGGGSYNADRVRLMKRYTAAWFNYYLRGQAEYFTYLYGAEAQSDIDAGKVSRRFVTAPRGFTAAGQPGAVALSWQQSSCPAVAGYNLYRRESSQTYPVPPLVSLPLSSSYTDGKATPGVTYYYKLRSRDAAGNEHAPSNEVSAIASPGASPTETETPEPDDTSTPTPTATQTATGTATPTPTASATPTPTVSATASSTATPALRVWLPLLLAGDAAVPNTPVPAPKVSGAW